MASRSNFGVSALEKIEAILTNPALYELAAEIPPSKSEHGGRGRTYPDYMLLVYEALVSVYRSARQVEAELKHPVVWKFMRKIVKKRFPEDESKWLPSEPMRRHHYLHGRNRYLACPSILDRLMQVHRKTASAQAAGIGLMDPSGPGSWTHPHLSRMLYADGKVVTPLFKAQAGDTKVDKKTGEIKSLRYEPDAGLHFEGTGETAYGTKFVMVAVRSGEERGRMILDFDWVPKPGAEAKTAMDCFSRITPFVPGAQGVIYDTALRGVHHQRLLRELGLMPVNKVTAAEKGSKKPRRSEGQRVEKSVHFDDKEVTLPDGSVRTLRLFAQGGAVGVVEFTDSGEMVFKELTRKRTHCNQDKTGLYRWYNDYVLPQEYGGAGRSRTGCTVMRPTSLGNSTVPRTSGPSHRAIPTSRRSMQDATTPNRSTEGSTTRCGSQGPIASGI